MTSDGSANLPGGSQAARQTATVGRESGAVIGRIGIIPPTFSNHTGLTRSCRRSTACATITFQLMSGNGWAFP